MKMHPKMIAVLTDEYTAYQKLLIDSVTTEMQKFGIGTLCIAGRELDPIDQFHESYAVCNTIYPLVNQYQIGGLISLTGTLAHNASRDKLVQFLNQYTDIPIVSLGFELPGYTSVIVDNKTSMKRLMEHVVSDTQRKKFCFVRGYKDDPYSLEREDIFRTTLQEHGHPVDELLFVAGNYDSYDTYNGVNQLLKSNPDVDVIIAANDVMALSAVRAATSLGFRIPTDIMITGHDDTSAATQVSPALTTVRQPINELAATSARILLEKMQFAERTTNATDHDGSVHCIDCELIVRGSSLSEPVNDHAKDINNNEVLTERLSVSMAGLSMPTNVDMKKLAKRLWNTLNSGSDELSAHLSELLVQPMLSIETHWWNNICHQIEAHSASIQESTSKNLYTSTVKSALTCVRERVWLVSMDQQFEHRRLQNTRTGMQIQMSSCTQLEDILATMGRWLESINAQRCFLVRYLTPAADPADMAELIHAFTEGASQACSYEAFASKHVLPAELISELQSGLLVLNPVYAGDSQFGYLLLDPTGLDLLHMDSSAQSIGNAMRNLHLVETLEDQASRLQSANTELIQIANYDELTGLSNRFQFQVQLQKYCQQALNNNNQVALLFIDLDGFKLINDTLGHGAGDQLLKIVADRLNATADNVIRFEHTISRIGGDEFTVIISLDNPQSDIAEFTQALLDSVSAPCKLNNRIVNVSASIGIATFPGDSDDVETLVKFADIAMYRAKETGKNRMALYTKDLNVVSDTFLQMDHDMRDALEAGDICMHYQPRIDLKSGTIYAVEALMRWMIQTPEGSRVRTRPDVFIKVAETTGFITQLDTFALEQACYQARSWELAGFPLLVAVNLSVVQLQQDNFITLVESIIEKSQINPALLEFEITESAVMTDMEESALKLEQLRNIGIQLSIDDFGTGYSSLSYLKRLPVNNLKIDSTFLSDITQDDGGQSADAAIVRSVVALGKSMDFKLIAEGIETRAQHNFVKSLGVDQAQGYLFAKPQPPEEITTLLIAERNSEKAA